MEPSGQAAFAMLRFFRDTSPTVAELQAYLDGELPEATERVEILKQGAMIVCQKGRWILAPSLLSADGRTFTWDDIIIWLDEDRYVIPLKVTWMPRDWESIIGITIFFYFFFSVACAIGSVEQTTGFWIRDGVGGVCGILIVLMVYADVFSPEWTRVQKLQSFAQRTLSGLLLLCPMLILNYLLWK